MQINKKILYSLLILALAVGVAAVKFIGVLESKEYAKTNPAADIHKDASNTTSIDTEASVVSRRIEQKLKAMATKEASVQPQSLKVIAAGDILLGRGVEYHVNRVQKDFTYPFKNVADILRQGDVIFGNLEAPLTESTTSLDPNGKIVLKSPEKAAEGIKYAGFNVLISPIIILWITMNGGSLTQ